MLIYILRHGETNANREKRFQGHQDWPLNEDGRALAKLAGAGMRGIHFDYAITSPLLRARETAEIVLRESGNEATPLTFDDRLKEMHCGVCEGVLCDDAGEYTEKLKLFFRNPLRYTPEGFPDGETVKAVCDRTQAMLRDAAKLPYETVLLSTHGCATRAMLNFLYDDPSDFWHGHVPYNCSVNIVETDGTHFRIVEEDKLYYDPALAVDRFKE